MLGIEDWLGTLSPTVIYLVVAGIIMTESMGIPIPGELTLVSAALLAAVGVTNIVGVAVAAAVGAIVGDSIGYYLGHRGGRPLLERFGRRFPRHFGPPHLARAEKIFYRWGSWAVFFGRFVALLRILAGPLAGALRMRYGRFLFANAAGGIVWSFGTAFTVYKLGQAAERYLRDFSWVALVVAVVFGIATTIVLRRRAAIAAARFDAEDAAAAARTAGAPTAQVGAEVGIRPVGAVDSVAMVAVEAAEDGIFLAAHHHHDHGQPADHRSPDVPASRGPDPDDVPATRDS